MVMRLESRFSVGDRGAVYEFKVKLSTRLRGVNVSDYELEQDTEIAIEEFAAELRKDYPWVGAVSRAGRSGGWLAIEDKKGEATEDALSDIDERVTEARKDFEKAIIECYGYTENSRAPSMRPNPVWPVTAEERVDLMNAISEAGYTGQKAAHVIRELNWWRKHNSTP
jgi:hypothetical protein